jgi:hypothetical protein
MVGRSREKGLVAVGVMGVGLPPTTPLVDCKAMPVHVFMPQPIVQGAAQRGRPAANGPQPASRRPARRAFRLWPADRPAPDVPSRCGHYPSVLPQVCHWQSTASLWTLLNFLILFGERGENRTNDPQIKSLKLAIRCNFRTRATLGRRA